ncbi:hypothetical protein [Catalinimonas niigatensis]|uniref:hypothetical protein n=1 Tax=Catalinimonas niigatensis TaxID=1397264 RepID=UPI0026661D04|nr:hypothetical protein [Catalinimonas niigatensis]WPP49739.1 hypothetical protein PZB72_24000 [Catalinimonas niigatensis]
MIQYIKYSFLVFLFSSLSISFCFAHALYIDTQVQGKLASKHEVKVYYSEFADRTVEKVSDWYSDVAKFELWLVDPAGNKTKLSTTAQEDHFVAEFLPEKEGFYRLEINHTAEDPGDQTAYQFNAFAHVQVGRLSAVPPITTHNNVLSLIEDGSSLKNNKTKTFKTYLNGQLKGKISATVFLPSGDKKEVESNADGVLKIDIGEQGVYFLEATIYHKDEAGKTKKAAYQSVWRCATQKFEI